LQPENEKKEIVHISGEGSYLIRVYWFTYFLRIFVKATLMQHINMHTYAIQFSKII